jgi:zinc transporter ZupT
MIILIAIATAIFTALGGLVALRLKDKLHLLLGFSAGAVVGVAFFDLLPEAVNTSSGYHSIATVTAVVAVGFIAYLLLDRFAVLHAHFDEDCEHCNHRRGALGAGSLSVHSLLDGIAIGLAFQVSQSIGIVVAIAVLVHDFSDGINTVNLVVKNGGTKIQAMRWLAVDALAPVIGVLSTLFFKLPESVFSLALAGFCGFFLYIGASDLLPESHHNHPTRWTTLTTALGIAVIYLAVRLTSG